MNFEQFGTGSLHIGYFFLVAVFSGVVAFLLAASIKPSERFWSRARSRHGLWEFNDPDPSMFSKSKVVWGWVRRALPIANTVHTLWDTEKWDALGEDMDPEEITFWTLKTIPRFLRALYGSAVRRLKAKFQYFWSKDTAQSKPDEEEQNT